MEKPSNIEGIKVVFNLLLPIGHYFAMTFFGYMFIKKKSRDLWNWKIKTGQAKIDMNHEMIHVKQAQSTGDSWLRFYLEYIFQWLRNNPFLGLKFAYRMNPFEMEAYAKQTDLYYVKDNPQGCVMWRMFKKLSVTMKRKLWAEYLEKRESDIISFTTFIQKYVLPTYAKTK